ncbi:Nn.00g059860.m01.CDS01 [Neocucurbitaria sp. VM-36]
MFSEAFLGVASTQLHSLQCNRAQQLMPPPRLPRHLRPCHPRGTAHQVRCASKAARGNSPFNSDEAAQSVSSAATYEERRPGFSREPSWWDAALSSITPLGSKPASAEPTESGLHPSNAPIAPPPTASSSRRQTSDEQVRGELGKHAKEEHVPERVLGPAQRRTTQQGSNAGRPRNTIRMHATLHGLASMKPVQRLVGETSKRRGAHSLSKNRGGLETSPAPQDAEQRDFLKKGLLFRKYLVGNSLPTPATRASASQSGIRASRDMAQTGEKQPRRKPVAAHLHLLRRGWARYRASTSHLVHALQTLDNMSPHVAAPIASSIIRRLRVIALDAMIENDHGTKRILGDYPGTMKSFTGETNLVNPESSSAHMQYKAPNVGVTALGMKPGAGRSLSPVIHLRDSKEDTKLRRVYSGSPQLAFDVADQQADTVFMEANSSKSAKGDSASRDSLKSPSRHEVSEQSLLEELFPEVSSPPQSQHPEVRIRYPKLDPPDSTSIIRHSFTDSPQTLKERVVESFQKKGEQTTVLQLAHCSTELTEADFRRLIPRGKHIDSWRREGEFYKVIPGRDPLSLERLPFYYILFRDPESALAYQKNASRLHKLRRLHQPSNILSAIPPPKGFLEDGEDLNYVTSLYNLSPTHHHLNLNALMQPYNPALRALIERGGYQPIMPNVDSDGNRIWKVLLHIEGYEPTLSDLFKIFRRDAYKNGMPFTLRNESSTSVHRLRDLINLKTSIKPVSSVRPRAYGSFDHGTEGSRAAIDFEDPAIRFLMAGAEEDSTAKEIKQMVMNRVYNRWIIDFSDEDASRRFATSWHRRVLPDLMKEKVGWKDAEERRMCNTEVLW